MHKIVKKVLDRQTCDFSKILLKIYKEVCLTHSESIFDELEAEIKESIAKTDAYILGLDLSKSRVDLSEHKIVETKRRGSRERTTIKYDFCPTNDKIQESYGIEFRGVYSKSENIIENFIKQRFEISDVDYKAATKLAPITGDRVSVLEYLFHNFRDLVPYVDHWHHLLDRDFCDMKRGGGDNYFSIDSEGETPIFAKFRQIFATECEAHEDGYIIFEIDW